jgi:hypothetical protein
MREVMKMSTEAKMQYDLFSQLKTSLEDAPRDQIFLASYVKELEKVRNEEDIFIRLGLGNASVGGVSRGTGPYIVSVVSELYEPLEAAQKIEIRKWWHDKLRREAEQSQDLRTRLARLI